MSRYFLITPFGKKQNANGETIDFDKVQKKLVEPAAEAAGLKGGTTAPVIEAGSIHEDMFQLIIESDTVICDVSLHNANVWYELGIRHALRRKGTILIKGSICDDTPFDVLTYRHIRYETSDPASSANDLANAIKETISTERDSDSPVFKMLSKLEQPDPEKIQAVPTDFAEEVERAKAGQAAGWLRLLSDEVAGLRFQRPGLRLVGAAQKEIKDYEGAEKTWSIVQRQVKDDIEANLALADVYERLYRVTGDVTLLTESDQATGRALANPLLGNSQRAEAFAVLGRNQKSLWRREFSAETGLKSRRKAATNHRLIESYKKYRDAFLIDLNHYWSGLAALQMNAIARDLSKDDIWQKSFMNPNDLRSDLEVEYKELRHIVARGIQSGLERDDAKNEWADVSFADFQFILGEHKAPVIFSLYRDAITSRGFKLDSALSQLELFKSLGVNAKTARNIIKHLKMRFPSEGKKNQQVVVVAGHQIDDDDRPEPRFPAAAEASGRQILTNALRELADGESVLSIFASAASGADLLCHEICSELDLQSTICLPVPQEAFATMCLAGHGDWYNRFVRLTREAESRVHILSRNKGLPNWLESQEKDPWGRGNQWVVEMARAIPAERHILIVLWDGLRTDQVGGTAHVVSLAERLGFEIIEIKTEQLRA